MGLICVLFWILVVLLCFGQFATMLFGFIDGLSKDDWLRMNIHKKRLRYIFPLYFLGLKVGEFLGKPV